MLQQFYQRQVSYFFFFLSESIHTLEFWKIYTHFLLLKGKYNIFSERERSIRTYI